MTRQGVCGLARVVAFAQLPPLSFPCCGSVVKRRSPTPISTGIDRCDRREALANRLKMLRVGGHDLRVLVRENSSMRLILHITSPPALLIAAFLTLVLCFYSIAVAVGAESVESSLSSARALTARLAPDDWLAYGGAFSAPCDTADLQVNLLGTEPWYPGLCNEDSENVGSASFSARGRGASPVVRIHPVRSVTVRSTL